MNKRIKKLAEQARKHFPKTEMSGEFWVFDEGKFAELIVKECMDIARKVGNISEPDDFALDRCYEIEQRIQDRFGVEE